MSAQLGLLTESLGSLPLSLSTWLVWASSQQGHPEAMGFLRLLLTEVEAAQDGHSIASGIFHS